MLLSDDYFTSLMAELGPFEDAPHLAIAVSGGSDSLALAILAHTWAKNRGGHITALIVDHGLRTESNEEAQQTSLWLDDLGMQNHILTWEGKKPQYRIQELAREARYRLLEDWCKTNQVIHLLTAHQGDDQWETLMQRFSRNSGDRGLRGILPLRLCSFGRILRPFLIQKPLGRSSSLGVKKTDILEFLASRNQSYISDPSNENAKYERVRWRQNRPSWEEKGFTLEKMASIMEQACIDFEKKEAHYSAWALEYLEISQLGTVRFNRAEWELCDAAFQTVILSKVISLFQDRIYPVPTTVIENLRTRLNNQGAVGAAGCYFVKRASEILVTREVRGLPIIENIGNCVPINGSPLVWDCFHLFFTDDRYAGWSIEPLGKARAETLRAKGEWGSESVLDEPSYVLASLPCLSLPDSDLAVIVPFGYEAEEKGVQARLRFPVEERHKFSLFFKENHHDRLSRDRHGILM